MRRVLSEGDLREFRSRVCAVATEMLAELGCDGFNMRELAGRLGVSAMTTYRYFDSKNDIFAALCVQAVNRLIGRLEAVHDLSGSSLERLAALSRAYVDFAHEEPVLYGLMFDLSQPQIARCDEFASARRRLYRTLADQAGARGHRDAPERSADQFAQILWASLHGLATLSAMGTICDSELEGLLLDMVCRITGDSFHPAVFGVVPSAIERQPRSVGQRNGARKSEWVPLTAAE